MTDTLVVAMSMVAGGSLLFNFIQIKVGSSIHRDLSRERLKVKMLEKALVGRIMSMDNCDGDCEHCGDDKEEGENTDGNKEAQTRIKRGHNDTGKN